MAKRKIDMSGVNEEIRSGGRSKRVPEGDYLMKIVEGSWEEGEKADYIKWRFQIVKGVGGKKYKGATIYDNTSLSPKALWNLRNLIFAAIGKNMAGKAFNFDPESLATKIIGATIADEERQVNGKTRINSRPVDYFPKEKFEEADDDEEETEEETEEEETEEEEEDLDDVDVEDI